MVSFWNWHRMLVKGYRGHPILVDGLVWSCNWWIGIGHSFMNSGGRWWLLGDPFADNPTLDGDRLCLLSAKLLLDAKVGHLIETVALLLGCSRFSIFTSPEFLFCILSVFSFGEGSRSTTQACWSGRWSSEGWDRRLKLSYYVVAPIGSINTHVLYYSSLLELVTALRITVMGQCPRVHSLFHIVPRLRACFQPSGMWSVSVHHEICPPCFSFLF